LTRLQVQSKYPEVYESYSMQASLPESKYQEKIKFWEVSQISCFERWTIPYFLEREKEKKRPCLRLNYPPDGKCNDCNRGTCRYDKVCFMCGVEGHGAFQSFPGGKLKGELKCTKHRNFLSQLGMIRLQHGIDEDGLRQLFKLPAYTASTHAPGTTGVGAAATGAGAAGAAAAAGKRSAGSAATAGTTAATTAVSEAAAAGGSPVTAANASGSTGTSEGSGGAAATASSATATSGGAANAGNRKNATTGGGKNANSAGAGTKKSPVMQSTSAPVGGNAWASPHTTSADGNNNNNANNNNNNNNNNNDNTINNNGSMNHFGGILGDPNTSPFNQHAGLSGSAPMAMLLPPSATGAGAGHAGGSSKRSDAAAAANSALGLLSAGIESLNLQVEQQQSQFLMGSASGGSQQFGASSLGPLLQLAGVTGSGNTSAQQQQYETYDVIEGDGFGPVPTLRITPVLHNALKDEMSGAYSASRANLVYSNSSNDNSITSSNMSRSSVGCKGSVDVHVRSWKRSDINIDLAVLRSEVKSLRILSSKSAHISRILHAGIVEMSSTPSNGAGGAANGGGLGGGGLLLNMDIIGIIGETSDLGTLDKYITVQTQLLAQQQLSAPPPVNHQCFSTTDLQSVCVQLIEALTACHEHHIPHRDIRPKNILVARATDAYQPRQIYSPIQQLLSAQQHPQSQSQSQPQQGMILKLTNFTPCSLLNAGAGAGELDRWCAPELDADTRRGNNGAASRFQSVSDVWSLGLILYYLACGGQLPFESFQQAAEAAQNADLRRACLEKHGLQDRIPMLYDLIERLVRPVYMRTELSVIRCHPFLWPEETRRGMLINFANATMLLRGNSEAVSNFVTGFDKISPLYVFGADGWVAPMSPQLLALVQPPQLKQDFWWSGTYLLQAVKNQLQFPEVLQQAVYSRMTPSQAAHAYVRQITDEDFPRLLILLFELGGIHGKWMWDGDEIMHAWN